LGYDTVYNYGTTFEMSVASLASGDEQSAKGG